MRRIRSIAIAGVASALLLGSMAGPASAVTFPTRISIVQGIPGRTFDICIGRNELKSRARYGSYVKRELTPDNYTIAFRQPTAGRCRGRIVRKTTIILDLQRDLTVVGTTRSPLKWVFGDNSAAQSTNVGTARFTLLHAADVGKVGIGWAPFALAPSESVNVWEKGETGDDYALPDATSMAYWAMKIGGAAPLGGLRYLNLREGRRYDLILVGTNPRNAKWVRIVKPIIMFL